MKTVELTRRQAIAEQRQGARAPRSGMVRGADQSWRDKGLCRQVGPFLFDEPFDMVDNPKLMPARRAAATHSRARTIAARQVCQVCPVAPTCAAVAFSQTEDYGVMAGLDLSTRRKILLRARTVAQCVSAAMRTLGHQPSVSDAEREVRVRAAISRAVNLRDEEQSLLATARARWAAARAIPMDQAQSLAS